MTDSGPPDKPESPVPPRSRWRRLRKWLVRGALVTLAVLLVAYLAFTGPRDTDLYPPRGQSPYRLPWPAGVTRLCVQSNRGVVSHRGPEEFAYDFAMPVGSDVCAARAGTVVQVVVEHDGNGVRAPNNRVVVAHDDGTFAWYFHLKQGGSYVQPGDEVRQGQLIAASGNVGHSMLPHLHFHVTDADGTLLRVTFNDVAEDGGIPRMFKRYTSGNAAPVTP
jgi:murein DD-endopeptidase MepM/ murein hydrolase activator NlpD